MAAGRLLTLASLVVGAGCSPLPEASMGPADVGAEWDPADVGPHDAMDGPVTEVVWTTCDLHSNSGQGGAECGRMEVPRDWTQPGAETIEIGMKRVVSVDSTRVQLFLVHGGPGASIVSDLSGFARGLLTERRDLTVYGVDHRGLGGSHALACPSEQAASSPGGATLTESEWTTCIRDLERREGSVLPHLTTSNAMRDLAQVIERVRQPGIPVVVYGGSYGTYATLRYMKLFPEQADGIVLEGIQPPGQNFDTYDLNMNAAAERLFDRCRDSPSCRARLGDDPWGQARALLESISSGHCPALNSSSDSLRAYLGAQLFYAPIRDYLPVLVYRMRRCEARDLVALAKFHARISGARSGGGLALNDGQRDNALLFFHVALSEMWHWDGRPDSDAVLAAWRQGVMSTGLTVTLAARQADWLTYPRGVEVDAALPPWHRPLLMLHGALDAATTVEPARALAAEYTAPHQTWAEFPDGAHAVFGSSPDADGADCGRQILYQFLDDLHAEVDTSCTNRLAPIDFDGTPSTNEYLLGTSDAWDG